MLPWAENCGNYLKHHICVSCTRVNEISVNIHFLRYADNIKVILVFSIQLTFNCIRFFKVNLIFCKLKILSECSTSKIWRLISIFNFQTIIQLPSFSEKLVTTERIISPKLGWIQYRKIWNLFLLSLVFRQKFKCFSETICEVIWKIEVIFFSFINEKIIKK